MSIVGNKREDPEPDRDPKEIISGPGGPKCVFALHQRRTKVLTVILSTASNNH
jgi:hypothetical protein